MRIELKHRKVCGECGGDFLLKPRHIEYSSFNPVIIKSQTKAVICEHCTDGYTEETRVFVYNVTSNHFDQINGSYAIKNLLNPNLVRWDGERYQDKDWNDLNPQSLHIIEERECPECKNYIYKEDYDCQNCTDGKIEVETSFTVFQSQEEYDAEIIAIVKKVIAERRKWYAEDLMGGMFKEVTIEETNAFPKDVRAYITRIGGSDARFQMDKLVEEIDEAFKELNSENK